MILGSIAIGAGSIGSGLETAPPGLEIEFAHVALWGSQPVRNWANQARWGWRTPFEWSHTSGLPARAMLEWAHTSGLPVRGTFDWAHTDAWRYRQLIEWAHQDAYALISAAAIEWVHRALWRSSGLADQPISVAAQVRLGGAAVEDDGITLEEQQEGGYWIATVALVTAEDYHRFALGSAFEIEIEGETWSLLCDRREYSGPQSYSIHGLSVASRYDFPLCDAISKVWEAPILASAVCVELLGAITWNLIDWMTPAYRLSCDLAAPMAVTREIIETAGGVLDIAPDGSFTARPEYPVPPLDTLSRRPMWFSPMLNTSTNRAALPVWSHGMTRCG